MEQKIAENYKKNGSGITSFEYGRIPMLRLPVRVGDHIKMIDPNLVVWIEAEGRYTIITLKNGSYLSNYPISELKERFTDPHFVRIHRSHIINLNYVLEFVKDEDMKYRVVFDVPVKKPLLISRNHFTELLKDLGIK